MKLGYRPDEAADVIGSVALFDAMVTAGWITPVLQQNKLTLYAYSDLVKCWERLRREGRPPAPKRKKREEIAYVE